jgi:hypothetical protein
VAWAQPAGDALRWRYALWDNDATFGHYINYTGVPDDSPAADPCNAENLPIPEARANGDPQQAHRGEPDGP